MGPRLVFEATLECRGGEVGAEGRRRMGGLTGTWEP